MGRVGGGWVLCASASDSEWCKGVLLVCEGCVGVRVVCGWLAEWCGMSMVESKDRVRARTNT